MHIFHEPGRRVGHVFLDTISGRDPGADLEVNIAAVNVALRELSQIEDAYSATISDDDGVTVDISNLVGGPMVVIHYLVEQLTKFGISREEVVAGAREYLDQETSE